MMDKEPERWRTVMDAQDGATGVAEHWSTCLMHVTYGGKICVCAQPAGHGADDETGDTLHQDYNASVAWTDPLNVWKVELSTGVRAWRYWWYAGVLNPRSMAVGAVATLFLTSFILAVILLNR